MSGEGAGPALIALAGEREESAGAPGAEAGLVQNLRCKKRSKWQEEPAAAAAAEAWLVQKMRLKTQSPMAGRARGGSGCRGMACSEPVRQEAEYTLDRVIL
jgi:hypothetical protein